MKTGDKARYVPNEKYHGHFKQTTVTLLEKHDGGYWVSFDDYDVENNCYLAAMDELKVI